MSAAAAFIYSGKRERYNIAMSGIPQDAKSTCTFFRPEHMPWTQSSVVPVSCFPMLCSQGSRHVTKLQSLLLADSK